MTRNQAGETEMADMTLDMLARGIYVTEGVAAMLQAFDTAFEGKTVVLPELMRLCILAGMEYATTTQMALAVHGGTHDSFTQLAAEMSAVQHELRLTLLPAEGAT
jgi:hypothetical protein